MHLKGHAVTVRWISAQLHLVVMYLCCAQSQQALRISIWVCCAGTLEKNESISPLRRSPQELEWACPLSV